MTSIHPVNNPATTPAATQIPGVLTHDGEHVPFTPFIGRGGPIDPGNSDLTVFDPTPVFDPNDHHGPHR
jgi:hypothetical protein